MSLEKCEGTFFKTVSPTDDFETIKNGITLPDRHSNFPVLARHFRVFVLNISKT